MYSPIARYDDGRLTFTVYIEMQHSTGIPHEGREEWNSISNATFPV
jgi:hypothetical protein